MLTPCNNLSGKSTLIAALLRLVDLKTGSITVDSVDIATIPCEVVRASLTAIAQEPALLPCTLRQHFGEAPDSAIWSTLEKVNLAAVARSRGGLDIPAGDLNLSHGQQHLLMFAVANFCPGRIVILDEATSSMDAETEEIVQRVLEEDFRDRTVISVAHKDSALRAVDRVIEMSRGRIVAR